MPRSCQSLVSANDEAFDSADSDVDLDARMGSDDHLDVGL